MLSLKNNFYIYHSKDGFILHNFQSKESFMIDLETIQQLFADDVVNNKIFQEAGIIGEHKNWLYGMALNIYHSAAFIRENEIDSDFDFWRSYLGFCEDVLKNEFENIKSKEAIILPEAKKMTADFYELLKNRRTIREFFERSITLQQLADVLFVAFGKFHENYGEEYLDNCPEISWRRSSPSAGGLNCLLAYILVNNVEGLKQGVYLYDSLKHCLYLVDESFHQEELVANLLNQDFALNSAANIVTVANLALLRTKYFHEKSYTLPFLDNGHLMQTAILTLGALGLQYWISSAFCDEYFSKLLHLNENLIPVCFLALGHGLDESLGPKNRAKIKAILEETKMFNFAKERVKVEMKKESEDNFET